MTANSGRWSVLSELRLFLPVLFVQVSFAVGEWVDTYGLTSDGPVDDVGPTIAAVVLVYPFVFTLMTLGVLSVLPSTRRVVWSCLGAPRSRVVYAVAAASLLLIYLTDLVVVGYVVGWIALLIAAITQFDVEERGPQPWTGLLFLASGYVAGLYFGIAVVAAQADPSGFGLPDSLLGWVVAVLSLGVVVRAGVKHWKRHTRTSSGFFAAIEAPTRGA